MDCNKFKSIFCPGNAVTDEPDYGLAKTFVLNIQYKSPSLRTCILTISKNTKQEVVGRMSTY